MIICGSYDYRDGGTDEVDGIRMYFSSRIKINQLLFVKNKC